MSDAGYKVIGIGEWDGGLYNRNGIDIDSLIEHRQRNNTINGFKGAEPMSTADLLVTDCDILIPAATENVITSKNVNNIKAKIIAKAPTVLPPHLPTRYWPTRKSS